MVGVNILFNFEFKCKKVSMNVVIEIKDIQSLECTFRKNTKIYLAKQLDRRS